MRVDAAAGDIATDVGRTETEVAAPSGAVKITGKYLHAWHKIGGQWKLFYSMSSSNGPPAAAAPASTKQ